MTLQMDDIPIGWVTTTLEETAEQIRYGYTATSKSTGNGPKYLRITDIQEGQVEWDKVPHCDCDATRDYRLAKGDIVIARTGATTGKSFLLRSVPVDAVFASYLIRVRLSRLALPEYVNSFLQSPNYWDQIIVVSKGTAQPGANAAILGQLELPIPPLPEQRRIVAKIEGLQARSRKFREALETIPQMLERFRQSVISDACSGKLTAEWRRVNEVDNAWRPTILEKIIIGKPKNGYSAKPVHYETPFRVLTLTATTSGTFDPRHYKFFDEPIPKDSAYWLQPNDILVQRGNTFEYVGVPAIYTGLPNEFIYPDLMMRLRAGVDVMPEFLVRVLSDDSSRDFLRSRATGTAGNMPKINQTILMALPVLLPSMAEQREIVHRIEKLFRFADEIAIQVKQAQSSFGQLDDSILAKAFRGELVPQDPNDEPASVLLERIRAERACESNGKQGGSRKRTGKPMS